MQKNIYGFVRCGHPGYFSANGLCAVHLIPFGSCKNHWPVLAFCMGSYCGLWYLLRTKPSVFVCLKNVY